MFDKYNINLYNFHKLNCEVKFKILLIIIINNVHTKIFISSKYLPNSWYTQVKMMRYTGQIQTNLYEHL